MRALACLAVLLSGCDDFSLFSSSGDAGGASDFDQVARDLTTPPDLTLPLWRVQQSSTTEDLNAVWGSGADDVWAVGTHGVILHADGTGWNTAKTVGMTALNTVFGERPGGDDVWMAGDAGLIVHYTGGAIPVYTMQTTAEGSAIYGGAQEFLVGASGSIYQLANGQWAYASTAISSDLLSVWSVASDSYIVGKAGVILHRTLLFSKETSGTMADLRAVWGASPADVVAVGAGGEILQRSITGKWQAASNADKRDLRGLWGDSASDIYAVGDSGVIVHSADGGGTWTVQFSGVRSRLNAVWGSDATDVYVVGAGGLILHHVN